MIRYIPNFLTLLRVIAIPFFIFFVLKEMAFYALLLFVIASITDYFDGLIARKFNIVTDFGKLMDPLADKILVLSALVLLSIQPISLLHWSVTAIIAFREIAVTILREYYHKKNIIIPAALSGKIKTTLQMTGIITALVFYTTSHYRLFDFIKPFENNIRFSIQIFFWVTVIVTILSGLNYFIIPQKKESL